MNILASPIPPLQLLGAQRFQMSASRNQRLIDHRHNMWILEIITRGRLQISMEGRNWITLAPNDAILYAPRSSYWEKVLLSDAICHSVVLFFEAQLPPDSAAWNRFNAPYLKIHDAEKILLPLAEESLRYFGMSDADNLQANAAFLNIVAYLLRAEFHENMLIIASNYPESDIAAQTHRYMRQHLAEPLQLAQIAAALGMSVSGLSHSYRRQTGDTPMAALRRIRVETVKSYLMRDRFTLEQIARETGFADAFHLSRTFKKITGISPRQFRRNITAK